VGNFAEKQYFTILYLPSMMEINRHSNMLFRWSFSSSIPIILGAYAIALDPWFNDPRILGAYAISPEQSSTSSNAIRRMLSTRDFSEMLWKHIGFDVDYIMILRCSRKFIAVSETNGVLTRRSSSMDKSIAEKSHVREILRNDLWWVHASKGVLVLSLMHRRAKI
jgi:hypothetical protein